MHKRYIFLAVMGLLVGYIAQSNFWFADERDAYFPITREHLQNKVRAQKLAQFGNTETDAPTMLADIYNRKVLSKKDQQLGYFEKIKTYFAKQNFLLESREISMVQNDLSTKHKLSFLMSLSQHWEHSENIKGFSPEDYSRFLMEVSKNKKESLLVRKQAYKNWLIFTEGSDQQVAQAHDSSKRMAQLVSFSDEKLIDSLTSSEN